MENIWEEVAWWQQHDERRNLEIINRHEAATMTEIEVALSFRNEVKRTNTNDI